MERCELIRTVAVLAFLGFALVRMAWEDIGDLIRSVRGRLTRQRR
jgi:hypothetical protein